MYLCPCFSAKLAARKIFQNLLKRHWVDYRFTCFCVLVLAFVTEIDWKSNWCQILVFLPRNQKFSTGLFTSRTTPPRHDAWAHTRGRGPVCHRWVTDGSSLIAHTGKRWQSALFHGGISFLIIMTYILPEMKDGSAKSVQMYIFNIVPTARFIKVMK